MGGAGGRSICHIMRLVAGAASDVERKLSSLSYSATLQLTVDTNIGLDNAGAYTFGEIFSHNYQEGHIITSMSLAISSGFLTQRLMEDLDLRVKGLVYGERVSRRRSKTDDLISQLGRLFYHCGTKDAPMGVPFSQVCDGVRNCGSGADESICEVSGYPS